MKLGRLLTITHVIENITQVFKAQPLPLDKLAQLVGRYSTVVPLCYLYLNVQNIPDNAETLLIWDEAIFDTESLWDPGDPGWIYSSAARKGLYLVTLSGYWLANDDGDRYEVIYGGDPNLPNAHRPVTGLATFFTISGLTVLHPESSIGALVMQSSGAPLDVSEGWLLVARIGGFPSS